MFKRVEKRRRKQEEEEKLGLDGEMKDILGFNDTDSDESDSDTDSTDSESQAEDKDEEGIEKDGGDESNDAGNGEEVDDEDEESSDDEPERPTISLEEALRDPVYVVSIQPDVKACVVCPGKLLKTSKVLTKHRESRAHQRRLRQFTDFAKSSAAANDSNAWDVVKAKAKQDADRTPPTISKRDEKRAEAKAKIKARRLQRIEKKQKAKAEAEAAGVIKENPSPAKKKRKHKDVPPATENQDSAPTKKKRRPNLEHAEEDSASIPAETMHKAQEGAPPTATGPPQTAHSKPPRAGKGRAPRRERLERLGRVSDPNGLVAGKPGGQKRKNERGKTSKKDKSKPLQIFD
ncbi:hypothetical protein GGX14DRAFT_419391 [Mycena pura]|uniref:Uncharacterized protein n=1 Tax=Mycena pura TaxID=153505 RepID=A0AAD6YS68_9AGAR|nr:hypothetical protein GGX14DRAFT_419391 [Mycena pura]